MRTGTGEFVLCNGKFLEFMKAEGEILFFVEEEGKNISVRGGAIK